MLQMYTEVIGGRNVAENSSIVFDNKAVQTCCTSNANTQSNTITLNKSGFYKVDFNAVISSAEASSNLINIIMERNGVEMNNAQTGATSTSTSDVVAVSLSTLVRVRPSCESIDNTARLQFKVTGSDALLYFANVVVTKIA